VPAGCRPSFAASPPRTRHVLHKPKHSHEPRPQDLAIRVDGHLDDHWSAWLGALDVTRNDDGTTTITALIADQAQLHGVLAGLHDIGAVITELRTTDAPVSASKHPQTSACSPP
jgi:GTPase